MRRQLTITTLLACWATLSWGVPAWRGVIERFNPDGATLSVRLHGDATFHFFTDIEKDELLEESPEGYLLPVNINGRTLHFNETDVELYRNYVLKSDMCGARRRNAPNRMASIDDEGRTYYPTLGDSIHSLVVLIEYSDVTFRIPDARDAISRKMNEEGYAAYGGYGSARDYFRASSDGKFAPVFDVSEVITLPETTAHYARGVWSEALRYALLELHARGTDFSKYDHDNDGVIDTVYFIYAGYGYHDTGNPDYIWPHQGVYDKDNAGELTLDGKTFSSYACSNELIADNRIPEGGQAPFLDGIGTFCHEYAHVLGLPDFYDTNTYGNNVTPEEWSLMDYGCYNDNSTRPPLMSSYEKWVCHWTEFIESEDATVYTLSCLGDAGDAVRMATGAPGEFFVAETRARKGWDASLPEEGLLIWHIKFNKSIWENNMVNSRTPLGVSIHYADSKEKLVCRPGADGSGIYLFPEGKDPLEPFTPGTEFSPTITSIRYDASTGCAGFGYNTVMERPVIATTMRTPWRPEGSDRTFAVSWDEVQDAEAYLLTVYKEGKRGRSYLDGCDERIIVGENSYIFSNVTLSFWEDEVKASVRVVKGLPAVSPGEEISFVPAELGNVKVESPETEEMAETEAVYYNLSGQRLTGTPRLPDIYVRHSGGNASKVAILR